MQTLTIGIQDNTLMQKVLWLLEHFKKDGLEIIEKNDLGDLRLLAQTRDEERVAFEEYLNNDY
jgi:hypothetical protein